MILWDNFKMVSNIDANNVILGVICTRCCSNSEVMMVKIVIIA